MEIFHVSICHLTNVTKIIFISRMRLKTLFVVVDTEILNQQIKEVEVKSKAIMRIEEGSSDFQPVVADGDEKKEITTGTTSEHATKTVLKSAAITNVTCMSLRTIKIIQFPLTTYHQLLS